MSKKVHEITGAWPIMISICPASTAADLTKLFQLMCESSNSTDLEDNEIGQLSDIEQIIKQPEFTSSIDIDFGDLIFIQPTKEIHKIVDVYNYSDMLCSRNTLQVLL